MVACLAPFFSARALSLPYRPPSRAKWPALLSLLCLPCGAALPSHSNHPVPPGHAHGNFHLPVAVCPGRCNFPQRLSTGVKMLSGPVGFLPISYHGVGLNKRRSASDRKTKTGSIQKLGPDMLKDSG